MECRNSLVAILILSLFYLCSSEDVCANFDEEGTCLEPCAEGTFAYLPGCDAETLSQRTCRNHTAKILGYLCDYARCDCHEPKVWDEAARQCVEIENCSDQSSVIDDKYNTTFNSEQRD